MLHISYTRQVPLMIHVRFSTELGCVNPDKLQNNTVLLMCQENVMKAVLRSALPLKLNSLKMSQNCFIRAPHWAFLRLILSEQ